MAGLKPCATKTRPAVAQLLSALKNGTRKGTEKRDLMDSSYILITALAVFAVVSIGAIAILWAVLPLSVFGIKDLIKKSVVEQEKTNMLLQSIDESLRHGAYKEPEKTPEKTDSLH